ncbi:hypothetical protein [Planktothrix agardhii]|jgi:hypothetical protein|nr:hypothetical protein [Planktothrix agardhii]MCF3581914.1 hypothetical protein [Planktothrix agardhii 1811]MCF3609312.1 hypothetical protein [Planktothrix agardhii 1033]MCF3578070.1 hypothetical protein [Planktothrix agardhii 1812]MCF3626610.1 hypothetical protein [Planktothrix agardhii 1801]MDS1347019.1 hypothetical protein [Planktothrix agardhii NRERC-751]
MEENMEVKGIKRGKIIELLQEIDLPDGVEITVEVKPVVILSLSERLNRLTTLFGAWQNQPELDEFFAVIDEERHHYQGREIVGFD